VRASRYVDGAGNHHQGILTSLAPFDGGQGNGKYSLT
jgi:hypothetical protein